MRSDGECALVTGSKPVFVGQRLRPDSSQRSEMGPHGSDLLKGCA